MLIVCQVRFHLVVLALASVLSWRSFLDKHLARLAPLLHLALLITPLGNSEE